MISALNQVDSIDEPAQRLGRPRKYSDRCFELLKQLYRVSEYLCADKLRQMIPILLSQRRKPIDVEIQSFTEGRR